MDVLGVDPSLTGTGLARRVDGVLKTTTVKTQPSLQAGVVGEVQRLVRIARRVSEWAPEDCLTVMELPVLAHGGMAGQLSLRIGLFWRLVEIMAQRGPVVAVAPSTRAVYAADSGRADKKAVLGIARARFPLLGIPDHNAADALSLCAMGCRWLGDPIDGQPTPKQLHAMTVPPWPDTQSTKERFA